MRILVIGGYGNFGKRLVDSLLAHYDYEIYVAGRSHQPLQQRDCWSICSRHHPTQIRSRGCADADRGRVGHRPAGGPGLAGKSGEKTRQVPRSVTLVAGCFPERA